MESIFLATAMGQFIRLPACDEISSGGSITYGIRDMGRATQGVRGIRLRDGDKLVSMEIMRTEGDLLTITENGTGRRTDLAEYKIQGKGGLGSTNIKIDKSTGLVVSTIQVKDDDAILVITQLGKLIWLLISEIRRMTKKATGLKVFEIADKDKIVSVALVESNEANSPVCPKCFRESKPAVVDGFHKLIFWKCECGFMDTDGQQFPNLPELGWPKNLSELDGWEVINV